MPGPSRTPSILHVDLDAFFVSVELLDEPRLRGRAVVVGGTGRRGVVAAASYEARCFGVHSAMPTARARRCCPHAVFLPGRHERYRQASAQVHELFRTYTPLVEGIGLDEAFLDVSGARRLLGDGPTIAAALRRRMAEELGLPCSVGVAPRKLTAKLASEAAKPRASPTGTVLGNGVVVVSEDGEAAFLQAHPVRALWGVGPAAARRLNRLGVRTVGDLAALPEAAVVAALGSAAGRHLHALASGQDQRPVVAETAARSVGHEETFAHDRHTPEALGIEVVRLSDAVASRLRRAGLAGRTVVVKVRFGDFRTLTRSATSAEVIDTGPGLAQVARHLLASVDPSPGVRLLGVSVSHLVAGGGRQLRLDEPDERGWARATAAVDAVRGRFGDGAIGPAAVLVGAGQRGPGQRGPGRAVKRPGDQQWGPSLRVPPDHQRLP